MIAISREIEARPAAVIGSGRALADPGSVARLDTGTGPARPTAAVIAAHTSAALGRTEAIAVHARFIRLTDDTTSTTVVGVDLGVDADTGALDRPCVADAVAVRITVPVGCAGPAGPTAAIVTAAAPLAIDLAPLAGDGTSGVPVEGASDAKGPRGREEDLLGPLGEVEVVLVAPTSKTADGGGVRSVLPGSPSELHGVAGAIDVDPSLVRICRPVPVGPELDLGTGLREMNPRDQPVRNPVVTKILGKDAVSTGQTDTNRPIDRAQDVDSMAI